MNVDPERPALRFPDPRQAPADQPLGWGGDLTPATLISAYRQGIFPWYDEHQPVFWWCPDPRCVLFPVALKIGHGLRRRLRRTSWTVTLDHAFGDVIAACAAGKTRKQEGTWITAEMQAAYGELHRLGVAHSVECWEQGRLIGGLYGVALGRVFFGESMFHHETDASKVAFVRLVRQLEAWGFLMIDCQQPTDHLLSLGATLLNRDDFLDRLELAVAMPQRIDWAFSHCAE